MPVRLSLAMDGPKGAAHPRDASAEERAAWVKKMKAELDQPEAAGHFASEFDTDAGNLTLEAHRHGTAIVAIWGAGSPPELVAISVFLCGRSGEDDAAALKTFREHPSLQQFPPNKFTRIQAQTRPHMHVIFSETDPQWYENGHVVVAAMALAAAMMAAPGAEPTVVPADEKLSPEEEAKLNQEIADVMDVFQIIQNDWVDRKKLRYTVRSSERISGRPVSDIMHVQFWVGVQGHGRTLSINGLVAVFLMLGDYVQKLPNLQHMKTPTTKHRVSLRHEPSVIENALKNITITEPE